MNVQQLSKFQLTLLIKGYGKTYEKYKNRFNYFRAIGQDWNVRALDKLFHEVMKFKQYSQTNRQHMYSPQGYEIYIYIAPQDSFLQYKISKLI